MGLADLPPELVIEIALASDSDRDINALCRVSTAFYHLLNRHLYRHNVLNAHTHAPNERLRSAVLFAAAVGWVKPARLAIQAGADVNAVISKTTALIESILHGNGQLCKFFLDQGAIYEQIDQETSATRFKPLHAAASYGYINIVRHLIRAGANVNGVNPGHSAPLHFATLAPGKDDVIKVLLENGADVNSMAGRSSVLHSAVKNTDPDVVKLLLDHGANTETLDNVGDTALGVALRYKDLDMVKVLLDNGASVATITGAQSPLQVAVTLERYDVVEMLLQHGATLADGDVDIDAGEGDGNNNVN